MVREYAVSILTYGYRDMMERKDLFRKLKGKCEDLVGKTVYIKSAKTDITIEGWYEQDNLDDNSKTLILVFTCDEIMKNPGKVLIELIF